MKTDKKLIKWASKLKQSKSNHALGWESSNDFTVGYTDALVHTKILTRSQANILNKCFGWDADDFEFDFKTGLHHRIVDTE